MADIHLANSNYATGGIDTATTLVDNVDPVKALHQNGPASAIVQIENILGLGTTLKGNLADLATRLAVQIDADGKPKDSSGLAFTSGSIVVAGASGRFAQDNANLFFDDTLKNLLVGTNTEGGLAHAARKVFIQRAGTVYATIRATSTTFDAAVEHTDATNFVYSGLLAASGAPTGAWAVWAAATRFFINQNGTVTVGDSLMDDPGAGQLVVKNNIHWRSGTSFAGTFDHANTAARTYTFPDVALTVAGRDNTETFTNKTINLSSNTLSGTLAQFNTAVSDANLVPETRTISPGTGLTGGGDLSADRTLTLANTAVSASTYGGVSTDPDRSVKFTVDAQGRLTAASQGNTLTAVLDRNSADTTVGTSSETTVYSFSVIGGTLGTDRAIRLFLTADTYTNSGGTDVGTIRVKYGATTLITSTPNGVTTMNASCILVTLYAEGATGSQRATCHLHIDGSTATNSLTVGTSSEDSTADKTFSVTHDWNNSGASITYRHAFLERV